MSLRVGIVILAAMCVWVSPVLAQSEDSGSAATAQGADAPYELGLHFGNLLPNQINGVTEIMGLGGLRNSYRLSPGSYAEGGFITGNGKGQEWKNIHLDLRMDIPVETLVALAYIGADATYYKGRDMGTRLIFGGHVGGGIQAHLAGSAWFRGDMKFQFSPGTTLYIGFGIQWRLGSSGGGGA